MGTLCGPLCLSMSSHHRNVRHCRKKHSSFREHRTVSGIDPPSRCSRTRPIARRLRLLSRRIFRLFTLCCPTILLFQADFGLSCCCGIFVLQFYDPPPILPPPLPKTFPPIVAAEQKDRFSAAAAEELRQQVVVLPR